MPRYAAIGLVIVFLAAVARFYHPGTGFTALIGFPPADDFTSPALRAVPHYESMAVYDGQFYAQRALDPLLRDPTIDRAMDLAPFRARRILFSWTAYAFGLGQPRWILEAYALQNVVCWLALAGVLTWWLPPTSGRGLALWTACLFSHGLLWSVRFALLDGPSLLLIACAIAAVERGRLLGSAAIVGLAGLGRETNLLAALAQPVPHHWRTSWRLAVALVCAALPLLIWGDYLWSIYRSTVFAGTNQFAWPGTALVHGFRRAGFDAARDGVFSLAGMSLFLLTALAVQALYLLWRREYAAPWWRVAVGYAVLMLCLDRTLVNPHTGAISRVMLPLTVGFNVLLAREPRPSRFWPWCVAGNLHLVPASGVLPLMPW